MLVCLGFSLGEAGTSMPCQRTLGERAWQTLTGNKGSLHATSWPQIWQIWGWEWKKRAGKQGCSFCHPKASAPHPSWDRVQKLGSQKELFSCQQR